MPQPPARPRIAPIPRFKADAITRRVMEDVTAPRRPSGARRISGLQPGATRRLLDDFFQWRFLPSATTRTPWSPERHPLPRARASISASSIEAVCRAGGSHYRVPGPLNAAEGSSARSLLARFVTPSTAPTCPATTPQSPSRHAAARLHWSKPACAARRRPRNSGSTTTSSASWSPETSPSSLNPPPTQRLVWLATSRLALGRHSNVIGMAATPTADSWPKVLRRLRHYINTMSNLKHCPYNPKPSPAKTPAFNRSLLTSNATGPPRPNPAWPSATATRPQTAERRAIRNKPKLPAGRPQHAVTARVPNVPDTHPTHKRYHAGYVRPAPRPTPQAHPSLSPPTVNCQLSTVNCQPPPRPSPNSARAKRGKLFLRKSA